MMNNTFFILECDKDLYWLRTQVGLLMKEHKPLVLRLIEEDYSEEELELLAMLKEKSNG